MSQCEILLSQKAPEIALKSLFAKYDINHDGYLDYNELKQLFQCDLGLNAEEMETYLYILDQDGDSRVSYDEFCQWIRSKESLQSVKDETRFYYLRRAIEMFQRYDTDQNMCLDEKEVRQLLIDSGGKEENLKHAIKELDKDQNGRISFQEFLKWLNWAPLNDLFYEEN